MSPILIFFSELDPATKTNLLTVFIGSTTSILLMYMRYRVRMRELQVNPSEKKGIDIAGPLAFVGFTTAISLLLSHPARLTMREAFSEQRLVSAMAEVDGELAQNCPGCPSRCGCLSGKCDCPTEVEKAPIAPPQPPKEKKEKPPKSPMKRADLYDERLNDILIRSPEEDRALVTFPIAPLPDRLPGQRVPF